MSLKDEEVLMKYSQLVKEMVTSELINKIGFYGAYQILTNCIFAYWHAEINFLPRGFISFVKFQYWCFYQPLFLSEIQNLR